MNIAIYGLGYPGSVSVAWLASSGHEVTAVDVDRNDLSLLQNGRAPVSEPGVDQVLGRMIEVGRGRVTDDALCTGS